MSSYLLWKLDPTLSPTRESPPVDPRGDAALTASELAELRKRRRAGASGREGF